jgi:hypothetical protein
MHTLIAPMKSNKRSNRLWVMTGEFYIIAFFIAINKSLYSS